MTAAPGAGPACPPKPRRSVLAVAILGSSLGFIDSTIVTVALGPIRESLGASFAAMQWVVNGYTLPLAAFLLVGGAAGDRYGRARVFGAGMVLFAAASALCGLAPTAEFLIGARVVQGLGAAMLVPGSLALIAANFPAAERGRAVGLWAAASGVTSALGPLVGGVLVDAGSWRAIFLVNVPVAALALALLAAKVPADPGRGDARFDVAGAALAFAGVGLIALGFTAAERTGLAAAPACLLAAGVVVTALFVAWQVRAPVPMMPLDMFASPLFAVANAATLLLYFALGGIVVFLPLTLMEGHGWPAVEAGAVFLPFTVAMAVVSPLAGRLVDRAGFRPLLVLGPLVVAGAFVWLGEGVRAGLYLSGVAPAMMALGVGMGLSIPPLTAAVLADAGEERSGIASGVNNAVARVAGLLAVAVLGLVASLLYRAATGAEGVGFAAPVVVADAVRAAAVVDTFAVLARIAAGVCLAAGVLALVLVPRRR